MHTRFLFLLAASAVTSVVSAAQTTQFLTSNPGHIFLPADRLPLSAFQDKTTASVTLDIHTDVLAWATSHGSPVHFRFEDGTVEVPTLTALDPANPNRVILTYLGTTVGRCVLVSDALVQTEQLEIVTHWDDCLNGGRGGHLAGATDGIKRRGVLNGEFTDLELPRPYYVCPTTGEKVPFYDRCTDTFLPAPSASSTIPESAFSVSPHITTSDTQLQYNAGGDTYRYYYEHEEYALFDDGSGANLNSTVPQYERYIGENFAMRSVQPKAALLLSDRLRARHGFPVAHRNLSQPGPTSQGDTVLEAVPVVQVLHGYIVDPGDDPLIQGYEQSLATIVLPPEWTSVSAPKYTALFYGHYDLHLTTFGPPGEYVIGGILSAYEQSNARNRCVGLIWNGGGAEACFTWQASRYRGAEKLILDAEASWGVDPDHMVFSGGSRSATTALALASNPEPHSYRARYVHARSPYPSFGSGIVKFGSPTYSGTFDRLPPVVGFHEAFETDFVDPVTAQPGTQAALNVLSGFFDPQDADTHRAFDAPTSLAALAAQGTHVYLRTGTHDRTNPHQLVSRYVEKLRSVGVAVEYEVLYRYGHRPPFEGQKDIAELLALASRPTSPALPDTTRHFATDPASAIGYTEFFTDGPGEHFPLTVEWPLEVGIQQSFRFSLVGLPGTSIQLRLRKVDEASLLTGIPVFIPGEEVLLSTVLADDPVHSSSIGYGTIDLDLAFLQSVLALDLRGYWWIEASFDDPVSGLPIVLGAGDTATSEYPVEPNLVPFPEPLLRVIDTETEGATYSGITDRTGGVSEDRQLR